MKLAVKEQEVVRAILDFLRLRRLCPIHVRTTGVIIKRDGKTFFGKSSQQQEGSPDIVVVYRGYPVALEVKSATGKQSPEQREWEQRFIRPPSNGYYVLVRSVGEVEKILDIIDGRINFPVESEIENKVPPLKLFS